MRSIAALVLAAGLLLAGCAGSGPEPDPTGTTTATTTSGTTTPAPDQVDGQAVHDWVAGVVTKPDGSPHFRVPGTADHAQAARWLAEQMALPGWTVRWQNFTGPDYQAIDKGEASTYAESRSWCSEADEQRLEGLAFSNLVAHRPASVPTGRVVFLGAHWESKAEANRDPDPANRTRPVLGANDGASGVGVLLQLMRELEGVELPYHVEVVLFDGEDGFEDCHPLAGSLWFVEELRRTDAVVGAYADGMGPQRRMLLLDMVGDPDARFIRESHSVACDPALVDLLFASAPRHGLADNFPASAARTPLQDDHVPFTQAGIPAVDLIDYGRSPQGIGHGFPPYWHTTRDTMGNLSPEMLGNVASLVLGVMRDPGFSEPWPGPC